MILLSHHEENLAAQHAARALRSAGVLHEVWTCSRGSVTCSRAEPHVACRRNARSVPALEPLAADTRAACRSLDQIVSTRLAAAAVQGVYAFEHGAESTFRSASRRGLLRIYDYSRIHASLARRLCAEEAALQAEWAPTLANISMRNSQQARTDAELAQADLVIVPSAFALRALESVSSVSAELLLLLPGAPAISSDVPRVRFQREKLRAIFVGPLSQTQGLSYLFAAHQQLRSLISLTVISPPPEVSCRALDAGMTDVQWQAVGGLPELRAELAEHDVLIAPAILDTSEPVVLEALALGIPVIATPHTSAVDFVADGVEGFIVPIRSTEALIERLERLHSSPDLCVTLGQNARARLKQQTWEHHERTLAAGVVSALALR